MRTNAEFVARVIGGLKGLTKDGHVSRRYILNIGKDKAQYLISQKLDEMTLFKEDGIISTLRCFQMEQIEALECCVVDFRHCKNVMKSVHKIPKTLFGKNGSGIIDVLSIDETFYFNYKTPRELINQLKRKYVISEGRFYSLSDGYLYLPDSEIELLNLRVISLDKWELDEKSSCCNDEVKCKSRWDYEFVCPDRFYDLAVSQTIQEVAQFYRTSIEDTNPNLDENSKSKTQA